MATLLKKRFLAQFMREEMNGGDKLEEKSDSLIIDIETTSDDDKNILNKSYERASETLYCICRRPYDDREFMIGCDGCKNWFHGRCVGITEVQAETIDNYYCADCLKSPARINGTKKRITKPIKTNQIASIPSRKPAESIEHMHEEDSDTKPSLRRSNRNLETSTEKIKPNSTVESNGISNKPLILQNGHSNGTPHKNGVGRPPKKKLLVSSADVLEKPKSPRLSHSAEPTFKASPSSPIHKLKAAAKVEHTEIDLKKLDNKRKKEDSEATVDENQPDEPPRSYPGKKRGRKRKKLPEELVPVVNEGADKKPKHAPDISESDISPTPIKKIETEIKVEISKTNNEVPQPVKERKKPGRKKKKHKSVEEIKIPDIAPRRAKLAAYFPDDYKKPIKPEKKKKDGGSSSSSSEDSYETETSSSESESSEEKKKEPVYCICQRPYDNRSFMLCCTSCKDWYHGSCLGLTWQEAKKRKPFICPKCQDKSKATNSPRRNK